MCGICGAINFNNTSITEELIISMSRKLAHRGPDDSGVFTHKNIGLGHRRLSVIDLSSGHQPISNENGNVWTVFNGEIYNFKQLRKYLYKKGHRFSSDCDSEVLVHLYEEFGHKAVAMLEGMFAYVIFDKKKNKLFMYRDRFGQKPLFYTFQNNSLYFASELQAITTIPDIKKTIDYQSFHDYLTLLYVPCPHTIFKNIKKLPPATYIEVNLQSAHYSEKSYWQCNFSKKINLSYNDAKDELRKLTRKAVKKRLMADVPLGAFLSGGVDSTIIAGLASEISNSRIQTFTIGFNDAKYDERYFAKIAANKIKAKHYEKEVNPCDFSSLQQIVRNCGEPYADSSIIPTYFLSKFARKHVTVALSGDAADEIFAGYYRYLAYLHSLKSDIFPTKVKKSIASYINNKIPTSSSERDLSGKISRILNMLSTEKNERYLNIISRVSETAKCSLHNKVLQPTQKYFDSHSDRLSAENPVESLMETDIYSYLHNDILTKVDIASMSNSLEVRSPFLDHKLVEFVNSLPVQYKLKGNRRKRILTDAFKDIIPPETARRNKMGFGVPVAAWLRTDLQKESKELLLNGKGVAECGFSYTIIENLLTSHFQHKADNSYLIWALLVFELWYKEFLTQ